ncbi:MAG TPA: 2-phosphosulfolactate phosphatase [Bacillales bacterium]|nr:2-phosphosulfolactate phosphatase [Bacillales bacterium]
MRKIHVLFKKEEIDESKIVNCVAVIIDVLLATSTIATMVNAGVKRVIPVLDGKEAYFVSQLLVQGSFILAGELGGSPLKGFENPDPEKLLNLDLMKKTLILSTTNGTVAIKKSAGAAAIYTSSLLNGAAVAKKIAEDHSNKTVLIICSGHLVHELQKDGPWHLSDAATIALHLYNAQKNNLGPLLQNSETGKLLFSLGSLKASEFVSKTNSIEVVPTLKAHSKGFMTLEDGVRKKDGNLEELEWKEL